MSLVSIIISNYNYAGFLAEAIESALGQTWQEKEIIVADDGSTDGSRDVIAAYGKRVVPLLKPNGGQTSALNAAYHASQGDVVLFVDADDALLPTAAERAAPLCLQPGNSKAHWPLIEIDALSQRTGKNWCENLPEGDLRETIVRDGPDCIHHPPTSGNAFARWFLEKIFPLPESRAVNAMGSD